MNREKRKHELQALLKLKQLKKELTAEGIEWIEVTKQDRMKRILLVDSMDTVSPHLDCGGLSVFPQLLRQYWRAEMARWQNPHKAPPYIPGHNQEDMVFPIYMTSKEIVDIEIERRNNKK